MDTSLAHASVKHLATLIKKGSLSPVELTEYYLDRIERLDPRLNSFMLVTHERARASAKAAETAIAGGNYLGPLHGIPFAVKDLVNVAGLPTTNGSILFKDRIAREDATVFRKLLQAGIVLIGKTGQVEFAFGGTGINHHYGTPWNPWDAQVQRIPGGSSSGSGVSVAADLVPAALGTDTGGSVRLPAAFNGLVGLKPTFGRVSTVGIEPLNPELDSPGPLVNSVEDAALFLQVLAGPDPADPNTWNRPCEPFAENLDADLSGMRVCFPREYFWEETDDEAEAAVRASASVFADLDVRVDEISIPEINEMATLFGRANISAVELFMRLRNQLTEQPQLFDPAVGPRIMAGKDVTAVDYLEIRMEYQRLQKQVVRTLDTVDALVTPTTPFAALPVSEVDSEAFARLNLLSLRNTVPANLLGLCAITLPCGFTDGGLPLGLQLIGRPFEERRILLLAHAFEQACQWRNRHADLTAFE
jgi:aspartyl-tRNA(Asn)/glutamyl-tRNA(Gln) amidotransferase subunit A